MSECVESWLDALGRLPQLVRPITFYFVPRRVHAGCRQLDARPRDDVCGGHCGLHRKWGQLLAATFGEHAATVQKIGNVGAELRRDRGEVEVVQVVQRLQASHRRSGVGAGAAEAGAGRNALVEVDARGQWSLACVFERSVGFEHGVVCGIGDGESACGQLSGLAFCDRDQVVEVDRLDGGLDVVEAVGAFADDPQVEVELGARGDGEGQPVDLSSARYLIARSL
jgi:hypothetical protein